MKACIIIVVDIMVVIIFVIILVIIIHSPTVNVVFLGSVTSCLSKFPQLRDSTFLSICSVRNKAERCALGDS